jgi:hypothetical protein
MKNVMITLVALAGLMISKSQAQAPDMSKPVKEKMAVLSNWAGRWKGEGVVYRGPQGSKSSVDEQIEWKLDGTVLLINGVGKTSEGASEKIVHEALGVLTYDVYKNEYKFRSWLRTGITTEAWFKVTGDNKYEWGFDVPNGKIKYSITLDPAKKTWNEVGEFSQEGIDWMKFFEMNLTKVE